MAITFKNPKKPWDLQSLSSYTKIARHWDPYIEMELRFCLMLACVGDLAMKRVIHESFDKNEKPEDVCASMTAQLEMIMDWLKGSDISFDISLHDGEMSIAMFTGYESAADRKIITSTSFSPGGMLSAVGVVLCCIGIGHGRKGIAPFVGAYADRFPCREELLNVCSEDETPFEKIGNFSSLLIFEEAYQFDINMDLNKKIRFLTLATPDGDYITDDTATKKKAIDKSLD